jgi:transcriptional regulator with XRE-family HTH domain
MPLRMRPLDRGTARGRSLVQQLCRELEEARLDRGLSYAALGRAVGVTGQQVGRICRGQSPQLTMVRIAQLYALVGLDLSARGFPGGQPLRDAGHVALLGRFQARLGSVLRWRTEVPIASESPDGPRDFRAWDAVVGGVGWEIGVEAETHVRDLQALERRLALKQRDGAMPVVILVLADTRHHRELISVAGPALRSAFPTTARAAMRSLGLGEAPSSNAVVRL